MFCLPSLLKPKYYTFKTRLCPSPEQNACEIKIGQFRPSSEAQLAPDKEETAADVATDDCRKKEEEEEEPWRARAQGEQS
jgi:hypothetical protein